MSPQTYSEFFLPYERELSDFYGGIAYWHSCGDVTPHVPRDPQAAGHRPAGLRGDHGGQGRGPGGLARPQALELRVFAKRHLQEASDQEARDYVRGILRSCRQAGVKRYVIRSSGMSLLLGAEKDLARLARWVELVREAQGEREALMSRPALRVGVVSFDFPPFYERGAAGAAVQAEHPAGPAGGGRPPDRAAPTG